MAGTLNDIYSVASVREIDRLAIESDAFTGCSLMTAAASEAVDDAIHQFGPFKTVHVVCGAGNNAGDGYVMARLLREAGYAVRVTAVVDPEALKGDAETARKDWVAAGGAIEMFSGELADADVLVDALLGSGLSRPVDGVLARAVTTINASERPVLALDLPTGLNGDTGEVMGVAVQADATSTFVGRKAGCFLGQGPDVCGELLFSNLGIDNDVYRGIPVVLQCLDASACCAHLPKRRKAGHKGDYGHVLVVGGGPGMAGAAKLCGEAALRTGAGRVSVATHPDNATAMLEACPELMVRGVASGDELKAMLSGKDVVAFGPGLGTDDWSWSLYAAIDGRALPMVWDADALNLLSAKPVSMPNRVITPHPGEAGALLELSTADVQADRLQALRALNSRYGGVTVLKGAGTLVTETASPPWICLDGNPGMATAGMGDVLTGVIAALIGQGLDLETAARVGVSLHAQAGDGAAKDGERGLIASDVIAALRQRVG